MVWSPSSTTTVSFPAVTEANPNPEIGMIRKDRHQMSWPKSYHTFKVFWIYFCQEKKPGSGLPKEVGYW